MTHAADIGSKRLISLAPDAWAQWVTQQPDVVAEEIIASDFQFVSRENDVLMRALSPTDGHFLLLNEIQLRYDSRMPRRVQAYAALAEERYQLPVYPVVVNILPPPAGTVIADRHDSTFMGLQSRRDYRVLNLWEIDADLALDRPVRSLLPLVPTLRGGGNEQAVRRALTVLRADEQLSDLEPLLAFFADFYLDRQRILQIMRWDMVVLRQSSWYSEIIEEGRQEGRQQGLHEGRQEGRQEELRRQIVRALDTRFGPPPAEVAGRLETLTLEQLDTLIAAAWTDDSLATFLARLAS